LRLRVDDGHAGERLQAADTFPIGLAEFLDARSAQSARLSKPRADPLYGQESRRNAVAD
jgi:hypothetical protein